MRPKLLYYSHLRRPFLIKYSYVSILLLQRVQCRATKFILGDYSMDYKSRLTNLKLSPLMYIYELTDILFAINLSKNVQTVLIYSSIYNLMNQELHLPILNFVTRFTTILSLLANSYFCRWPRLWNALPIIDLTLSIPVIKYKLKHFYGIVL